MRLVADIMAGLSSLAWRFWRAKGDTSTRLAGQIDER